MNNYSQSLKSVTITLLFINTWIENKIKQEKSSSNYMYVSANDLQPTENILLVLSSHVV